MPWLSLLAAAASSVCAPQLEPKVLLPSPGETGVPLNVSLAVDLSGSDGGVYLERIDPDGGSGRVACNRTDVASGHPAHWRARLTPIAVLEPSTRYRLAGPLALDGGAGSTLAYFTTGNGLDTSAPEWAGDASYRVVPYDSAQISPCGPCWRYDFGELVVSLPRTDERVLYTVGEGIFTLSADVARNTRAYFRCEPVGGAYALDQDAWIVSPGNHQFEVVAVDEAGNASAPLELDAFAQCQITNGTDLPFCFDAGGFIDPADSGVPTDAPDGGPQPTPRGCGCDGAAAPALLALAAALFARGRRFTGGRPWHCRGRAGRACR